MKKIISFCLTLAMLFLVACSNEESNNIQSEDSKIIQDNSSTIELPNEISSEDTVYENSPKWSAINENGINIVSRINTPEHFTREEVVEDSFADFVRNYSLKEYESEVLLFNGDEKKNQTSHIAVFDMPLVKGDLQQCADSIMRIYAEYYYTQKRFEKIRFHFVNGFLCDFQTWANGYRVAVNGNDTSWVKKEKYSDSTETFEEYLKMVFSYSSTLSMQQESELKNIDNLKIGDVFLKAGSPGHVVMVVDVCKNDRGEKAFLLAQGYMPAQEFHILKNPVDENNPWYYVEELEFPFTTPEYIFQEDSFRKLLY